METKDIGTPSREEPEYEPPALVPLGSVAELTQGLTTGGDTGVLGSG